MLGLVAAQHVLARARPAPWTPPARPVVAGVFVAFPRGGHGPGAAGDEAWAGAASWSRGTVRGRAVVAGGAGWPYRPGLLALREGPLLASAFRALPTPSDVLLVDATGADHPRRCGLARHLGAVLDVPTVGVTTRPLLAKGPEPAPQRGATSPLVLDGDIVAAWVRTATGARPLVVHPGWAVSLEAAVDVVVAATRGARTPEPLREARRLARTARAGGHGPAASDR